MKKITYINICIALITLVACNSRKMTAQLDTISQIADNQPDSALTLLSQLEPQKADWSEGDRMYFELVRLKAQNKAFITFTTDTIINKVVSYFQDHGTANEQMQAYYLQGRVFADMGEAPQALQAYYDAIESADTTSSDCDYNTLIPVYGQMSQLFHQQNLPRDEIWALNHYIDYIRRYDSEKEYVIEKRHMISPYYLLGKKDTVLQIINDSYKALRDMGENQEAASALVSSIYIYTDRGQLHKARQTMDIFEKESGLFNKDGDIAKGREYYYYIKGYYYLTVNDIDSAEYYYRKAIVYTSDAYKGLLAVYRKRQNVDSVLHYSILNERALDSLHNNMEIDAIQRMSSLYNYNRSQKEAEQERIRYQKSQDILHYCINILIILMFIIICIGYLFAKNNKEKRNKIIKLRERLRTAKTQRAMIQEELISLKSEDLANIIAKKEKQEEELTKQIKLLQAENEQYKENFKSIQQDSLDDFLECDIAKLFLRKSTNHTEKQIPNSAEWRLLTNQFAKFAPQTFQHFSSNNTKHLSELEQHVCLLLILGIPEKTISVMANSAPSTVSNAKTRANEKLYGQKQASTLKNNLFMELKGI